MSKTLAAMITLAACAGSLLAADAVGDAAKPKPYTLTTCIVSGDKIGAMGDAVVVVREGREIKFCCKGCIKDFDKDPAKFLKKIDDAEKAAKDGAKTDKPAEHQH